MTARVISGKAKGRRLKLVPGDSTRPIMDRVKESLSISLGCRRDALARPVAGHTDGWHRSTPRRSRVVLSIRRAAIQTIHDNLSHAFDP